MLREALAVARNYDVPSAAVRAYYNLANDAHRQDQWDDSVSYARDGLALARRLGDRSWEWNFLAQLVSTLAMAGDWDEALVLAEQIPVRDDVTARFAGVELLLGLPTIYLGRGQLDEAEQVLRSYETFQRSTDLQERAAYVALAAGVVRARGDLLQGLELAREACTAGTVFGGTSPSYKAGVVEAYECAFALGDIAAVEALQEEVAALPRGSRSPYLDAQATRFAARLAALRGEVREAELAFKSAATLFREIKSPFQLAITLTEYAEHLVAVSRPVEAVGHLSEAEEIFSRQRAEPMLARLGEVRAALVT